MSFRIFESLRVSECDDDGDDDDDDGDDDDDDDGDDDYDDDAPKSTTSKELNETLFGVSRWGHFFFDLNIINIDFFECNYQPSI